MMRNRVALVLMCLLALTLSACGGGGDDSSTGKTEAVEPSELSGTVTVWDIVLGSFSDLYDEGAKELDAEFEEKYPNVTVKHVSQPYETYVPIYNAAFAGRTGPDVMMMVGGVGGVLNYKDGLEVLNDRIPADMEENVTNWPSVTPGFVDQGDHYGVPIGLQGFVFYYNKNLFEKAGLPREFEPETWDEVWEAGEKLEAAGIQPFVGGDKEGLQSSNWFIEAWQTMNTEEQSIELSEGALPYTDEIVSRAFGPMVEVQEKGLYPEDWLTTPLFPDGGAAFGEEKGAMFSGIWSTAIYFGEFAPQLGAENLGMFQPPGSTYLGLEPNWAWSIPKFAENKEAAWAYIDYMGSRQGVQALVDKTGEFPSRKDVKAPAGQPPQYYELLETARTNDTFLHVGVMIPPGVLEVLRSESGEVLAGRTSLEDLQQLLEETSEKTSG